MEYIKTPEKRFEFCISRAVPRLLPIVALVAPKCGALRILQNMGSFGRVRNIRDHKYWFGKIVRLGGHIQHFQHWERIWFWLTYAPLVEKNHQVAHLSGLSRSALPLFPGFVLKVDGKLWRSVASRGKIGNYFSASSFENFLNSTVGFVPWRLYLLSEGFISTVLGSALRPKNNPTIK